MWKIGFESGATLKVKANSYFAARERANAICRSAKNRPAIVSIVKVETEAEKAEARRKLAALFAA